MSDPVEDIDAVIADAISQPQSQSADGVSLTERTLKELDEHRDRVANRQAASSGRIGISFFNTKPPGAT